MNRLEEGRPTERRGGFVPLPNRLLAKSPRILLTLILLLTAVFSAAQVPYGTEIRLVLLKELNSGGSVVGEEVPLAVANDVVVNGRVVVREGTLAVAKIKQARREGALSASFFDKPARLAMELQHTWDVDGNMIPLKAKLNGKDQRLYQFNRDNTKIPKLADKNADKVLRTDEGRKAVSVLVDALRGVRTEQDLLRNIQRATLLEVARALRLSNTVELLLSNRLMDLVNLGATLAKPGFAAILGARAAIGTVNVLFKSAKEIVRIGSHLPGFLSRKFGGRNINAAIGLELSTFCG